MCELRPEKMYGIASHPSARVEIFCPHSDLAMDACVFGELCLCQSVTLGTKVTTAAPKFRVPVDRRPSRVQVFVFLGQSPCNVCACESLCTASTWMRSSPTFLRGAFNSE